MFGTHIAFRDHQGDIPVVSEDKLSYCHSLESWQALWDGVAIDRTRFEVEASLKEVPAAVKRTWLAIPRLVRMA